MGLDSRLTHPPSEVRAAFFGVSFRIFKITVSAGNGDPAAWNSERTTHG
jgi:hypothetical protein